jgi:glycosyltransferase involved in cell wall biosynthesis
MPGYHATRRNASAILIGSRDTWRQMPRQYHGKCIYVPENAIDPSRFTARRAHAATRPLKLIFVGRLVPYKGADMLIEAAAPFVREGAMTLNIIGDGPQMLELKEMVRLRDLVGMVRLVGWIEHKSLQDWLAHSDLFAFPSIREFGGAVVLEAMAVGCVPIVMNYGGPGELVTPNTGYLVNMGTRQQIVERFRAILAQLANDPAQVDEKSARSMRRARELFSWDAKARQVAQVYDWLKHPEREKPRFAMPLDDLNEPHDMVA